MSTQLTEPLSVYSVTEQREVMGCDSEAANIAGERGGQRQIAGRTNVLQQDLNEHKIVIETLDGVDGDR